MILYQIPILPYIKLCLYNECCISFTCCYGDSLSLPGDGRSGEALNLTGQNGPMMQHHLYFFCHWPDLWGLLSAWKKDSLFYIHILYLHVSPYVLQRIFWQQHAAGLTAYLAQREWCVCEPLQLGCVLNMCTCQHGSAQQKQSPKLLHLNEERNMSCLWAKKKFLALWRYRFWRTMMCTNIKSIRTCCRTSGKHPITSSAGTQFGSTLGPGDSGLRTSLYLTWQHHRRHFHSRNCRDIIFNRWWD